MKACIVSDSHDRATDLEAAVVAAKAEGAGVVIHCGDVIGGNTLRPLVRHGLPVHVVHGNNLGDPGAFARIGAATGGLIHYHGADAEHCGDARGREDEFEKQQHDAEREQPVGEVRVVHKSQLAKS